MNSRLISVRSKFKIISSTLSLAKGLLKGGHNGGRLTCVCSLTQQCTLFCSIPVSYVRCFVLRDVLGLCGSVPGVAAVCASFWAVELTFSS